jgi:RNA polymerase sigma-70 factor (ECF subfamily)
MVVVPLEAIFATSCFPARWLSDEGAIPPICVLRQQTEGSLICGRRLASASVFAPLRSSFSYPETANHNRRKAASQFRPVFGGTMSPFPMSDTHDVTLLLSALGRGEQDAASKLIPVVYDELRRLAASYMRRERQDHTLQATALVHEAYVKLIDQRSVNWQSRAHFFGVAAQLMRRILIDHARGHLRQKRGGEHQKVSLDEAFIFSGQQSAELLALDESLQRLTKMDARQGRIVELRFFGGLSVEEAAEVLNVSPKTVKRDWSVARAWLYADMKEHDGIDAGKLGEG